MSRYEKVAIPEELTPEAIHTEVERILASEKFARSSASALCSVSRSRKRFRAMQIC